MKLLKSLRSQLFHRHFHQCGKTEIQVDAFREHDEKNLINFVKFLDSSFNKSEKVLLLRNFLEVFNQLSRNFPESTVVNFSTLDDELRLFSSNTPIIHLNTSGLEVSNFQNRDKNISELETEQINEIVEMVANTLAPKAQDIEPKHAQFLIQYASQVTGIPAYDLTPFNNSKNNTFQKFKEESSKIEFKSSLRVPIDSETNKPITNEKFKELFDLVDNELNEHINKSKDAIKLSFLKVLAAMLNGYGGTIRVGVADSGEVIGLLGDWEDMSSNGKKTLAEARGRYENWVSGSLISDNLGKKYLDIFLLIILIMITDKHFCR